MNELGIQRDDVDDKSELLAERLQIPLVHAPDKHAGLLLSYQNDRLTLSLPSDREAGSVCVDFTDPKLKFRLAQALSREAVVKAVGGCVSRLSDTSAASHVIDATAGLGLDGFILAAAGWQVSLIEQSPVMHALLGDGLRRSHLLVSQVNNDTLQSDRALRQLRIFGETLARLHLCDHGDSIDVLPTLPAAAVIYLDPMFPERGKTARVKKNRFLLQRLHGTHGAGQGLLTLSLRLAPKVVVKRPRQAEPLERLKPASSLTGKTSRFDIYVGRAHAVNMRR
jgi:16S rRNA (guanine1516-N2)-methyltransferase